MRNAEAVKHGLFGFDAGVMTVGRGIEFECLECSKENSEQGSYIGGTISAVPTGRLAGPTCGIHWPNILHIDPNRNLEIVEGWIRFLKPYDDCPDTILSPDSNAFRSQLAHYQWATLVLCNNVIHLSFFAINNLSQPVGKANFTIKVHGSRQLTFKPLGIKIVQQSLVFKIISAITLLN